MSYKLTCAVTVCTDEELNAYDGKTTYMNDKGNHECVVFVQSVTKVPSTRYWKKGAHIQSAKQGDIAKGTAIATFDEDGKYPTDSKGRHAAIYQSHTNDYIMVLDQWNKQGAVLQRPIKFHVSDKARRSNDGKTFYVIEVNTEK